MTFNSKANIPSCIIGLLGLIALGADCRPVKARQSENSRDVRAERQQFQAQELITTKFGSWIFQLGTIPKLVWRDVNEVQRLGGQNSLPIRWFDGNLQEHPQPNQPGRWMAWIEGRAPNGTPFRRSFTFFALPKKIEGGFAPDLTIRFPNFPGADAPPAWREHRSEFHRVAKDMMIRALIDSEQGAILMAGIAESKTLGRPKRYVESVSVANDEKQLALKLKVLGLADRVQTLRQPIRRLNPATELHHGSPQDAGVPQEAKAKIDQFCQDWAKATAEPFVTLVARRGIIITHEAFGHADGDQPVDLDYRCWVASITKTITALMFSQFVDQGLIELDAPISSVFPDFPEDQHVPTFRQCLNHTSGLAGPNDFGGMKNPQLENVILNGIDVNEPGKQFAYTGMGFELAAKAMEVVTGKSAVRLYHEHFFSPLGFGDVVLANASSGCELTAKELAILAHWVANQGSYGDQQFIRPETFTEFLPQPLNVPGVDGEKGLGLNWRRYRRPGADKNSDLPQDQLFSLRSIGHGSFSGCILFVDPEQQLVITQVRKKFSPADDEWYARFFQTVAAAIKGESSRDQ